MRTGLLEDCEKIREQYKKHIYKEQDRLLLICELEMHVNLYAEWADKFKSFARKFDSEAKHHAIMRDVLKDLKGLTDGQSPTSV